jgi:hypothetical protein
VNSGDSIKSWPLLHPSWEYQFSLFSDVLPSEIKVDANDIAVSHAIACIAVVLARGGMCVDFSLKAIRPFDALTARHSLLGALSFPDTNVDPAFIAAQPNHEGLSRAFDGIKKRASDNGGKVTLADIHTALKDAFRAQLEPSNGVMPAWVLGLSAEDKTNAFASRQKVESGRNQADIKSILQTLPNGWKEAKDIA